LGQDLRFQEGEGPLLAAIRSEAELARLNKDGLHTRLGPVYEAVKLIKAMLPPETTLIGFAGAPWTVATYMLEGRGGMDQAAAKTWAFGNPAGLDRLMDILVKATIEYLSRQVQAGAEVLQLFDTWAGVLPDAQFKRYCIDPVKRIIEGLKALHPAVPIIAFPRGAGLQLEGYSKATGANALGLDYTVPLGWARERLWGKGITVQGNLDPRQLVAGGPGLQDAVRQLLRHFAGRNYIFNLGHGILPETPVAHVEQLLALIRGAQIQA